MPFLIPLIPVFLGVATSAIAIAGALITSFGILAGNEDATKIGAVLSLVGGASGLTGAESSGVAGADIAADAAVAEGAAEATGGSLSAEAANELAVTGEVSGGAVSGIAGERGLAQQDQGLISDLLGPPEADVISEPPAAAKTGIAGDYGTAPEGIPGTDDGLAIKTPIEEYTSQSTDPAQKIVDDVANQGQATGQPTGQPAGQQQDYRSLEKAWGDNPSSFLDSLKAGWGSLDASTKGALIKVGGQALASAFGNSAADKNAETERRKYNLELEKYRTRMKNINNVGQISLAMNPQPRQQ